MKHTRIRDLLIYAAVIGVLANLLLRLHYDALPRLPKLAGLTLLVLALIEAGMAFVLRPRLQRKAGTRSVHPLTAVRVVAFAKASSLLGAIMFGAWVGLLGYVMPLSGNIIAAADDTTSGIVGAVCAVLLTAAALWLEYVCRTPDRFEDVTPPRPES